MALGATTFIKVMTNIVLLLLLLLLLTARPGAWRSSSFRCGLFIFLVLSVTRPRPLLGQVLVGTLNHETCNV